METTDMPDMWEFTVSMVMTDGCEGMAYTAETGVVPMGPEEEGMQTSTNFYNVDVDLSRPIGVCTTNIIGSSVIFTCEGDYINEHVYHDASQGPVPSEPDCSGEVLYVMPIENGCNEYIWGSMSAVWDGYCMPATEAPGEHFNTFKRNNCLDQSQITYFIVLPYLLALCEPDVLSSSEAHFFQNRPELIITVEQL